MRGGRVAHISILSKKPTLAGEDSKQLRGSCLGDGWDDEPRPAFFVLGYCGFRGFPALKIQAWETPKRPRSLLGWPKFRKKTSTSIQRFFARLLPGAKDGVDLAPLFLS